MLSQAHIRQIIICYTVTFQDARQVYTGIYSIADCDRWLAGFCPLCSAITRSWNEWKGFTCLQVSRTAFLASCWPAFFPPLLSPARPGREAQEGRGLSKGFLWWQSYRSPDTKHVQENRLKEEDRLPQSSGRSKNPLPTSENRTMSNTKSPL